ncbi:hypothetical protein C8Q75DRAFT_747433 [Abortiporus biennis]|nr:hypothetical protein C8Q75DRAFT_747433 [Abortiporus biennis]
MSDVDDSQGPRRSQREKKQATHFISVNSALSKRKRSDETSDDEAPEVPSEPEDVDEGDDDADVEEEFPASKPKQRAKPRKNSSKGTSKAKGPPPTKKPRTTTAKKPAAASKPKNTTGVKRGRKKLNNADENGFNADQVSKDTKITSDNALFNSIMNPSAALQSTAEDFLESLSMTPGPSQAELINCILRCCGCNDTVDEDEVLDYDGVVDSLDNFTEALKNDDSPVYPLTSKLPAFKKFRKSLSEFLTRIVSSAAALGQLYSTDLLPTLQQWVIAMSSSQLRAFRHTATVIAMEIETSLCEVAAEVEKEAEVVSRQREGERKRKTKGKPGGSSGSSARDKELENKAAEIRERRTKLAEYLKEFVDGVFIHRYRDLDPSIRAECVRAIGLWFSKYPSHFLDGNYLRYVGWVLSDSNTHVRLEAVKALSLAYEQTEYIGAGALQHFTERFKPRLVEMAMGDTELHVRISVVQVLQAINSHGLLEDEQTEKLCLLVFDEEAKMRKAVGAFVKGVWEEGVDERLVGKKLDEKDKEKVGVKVLASLLVAWGKALDNAGKDDENDDEEDDTSQSESPSKRAKGKAVVELIGTKQKGRIALAVEALWDEVDPVSEWETLLDILLLDHTASDESSSPHRRGGRAKAKQATKDEVVDEAWRLEEVEEGVLLEVLIAAIRRTKVEAAGGKKGEDNTVSSELTRALIKALPRLLMKYQTDEGRMANALLLPQLMNLDEYLEMRMMTAYSSLWDDITKQFLSHSSPSVLTNAVSTIRCMMETTSLSNTNSTKIVELEDELATSLRDAIAGRDEIEVASFSEDEVLAITAICTRLAILAGTREMIAWMEEDEGGKQSSAWDIINALAERGRLGYREEESMVDQALQVLYLHILWKARALTSSPEPSTQEIAFRDKLKEQRDILLDKLLEFAVGTQSNTAEGVRRAAFQNLMNIHILFCPALTVAPDGSDLPTASLSLILDEEVQFRCAGFVQAEIERYAEDLEEHSPHEDTASDDEGSDDLSDAESRPKKKKGKSGKAKQTVKPDVQASSHLEKEYVFIGVIATFLRAIKTGAIQFRQAYVLLAHYGRLGPVFNQCAKVIVDILREEGMYKDNGEAVVAVILQALEESYNLYMDGIAHSEDHTIALGKLLATCFLIRGAQLSVVRRLDPKFIVEVHTKAIDWLGKRLSSYENANNKKAKNKCLPFFKALAPLCTAIDTRDSMKIKAHLDQVLAQAKAEPLPSSKLWDGYRAYEKRLLNAKEKVTVGRVGKKPKKGLKIAEVLTTDEEGGETDHPPAAQGTRSRPKARPAFRGARVEVESGTDADDGQQVMSEPDFATPKAKSTRQQDKSKSPSVTSSREPSKSLSLSPLSPTPSPEPSAIPSNLGKRARSPEEEDEHDNAEDEEETGPSPSPSQETQANEMQIRRKRVRH